MIDIKFNSEHQYLDLLQDILNNGENRKDRTGTGTKSLFGRTIVHDFKNGFPLITTKKIHIKSVIYELLWFIKGDTNIKYLNDNGITIWDEWADENGDLGPIYGKQLRDFNGIDQLKQTINEIKENPISRRHVISLWNPSDIPNMRLPPCHGCFIQLDVSNDGKLNLLTCQRSGDAFLGVPFNLASYGLLLKMICEVTNLLPGKMTYVFGNIHIYNNHFKQVKQQIENGKQQIYDPPSIRILRKIKDIDDFIYDDFILEGYESWTTIKASVSV